MDEKADPDIKTEKERERDARVDRCLDPEKQEPLDDVTTEDMMPKWLMSLVQYIVLFYFGVLLIASICALILYFADEMAFVFDGLFLEYLDYICFGICVLTFIGSFVGLYALSSSLRVFFRNQNHLKIRQKTCSADMRLASHVVGYLEVFSELRHF